MPVIQLSLARLKSRTHGKASEKEILETLPYLGLDIEDQEEETISVEYSPNRPDFSSEAGVARSLLGLLNIETGAPKYEFGNSQTKVEIEDDEIRKMRPYISAFYAFVTVTDDLIKQLIAMQEDLTNGIGRHRSKVAIGIHNAEVIKPPIRYFATRDKNISFVPLYGSKPETISTILNETVQGRQYAKLVSSGVYPLLEDSAYNVLSMPPIINGELTRLKPGIGKLFFDVTSTDQYAGDAAAAIMASMLADLGAKVESVLVEGSSPRSTPDMSQKRMRFDLSLSNRILGLDLSFEEARAALEKSRLSLDSGDAVIPAFRTDIMHPIDLVEEVELGYGVSRLTPQRAESSLTGSIHTQSKKKARVIDVLVGLGLTEIFNLSLTNKSESDFASDQGLILRVDNAKSETYEFLKSEILPSLLRVLGSSTHEEYPQRIFELAPIFTRIEDGTQVLQEEHVGVAIADSGANFSQIKSILEGFLRLVSDRDWKTGFNVGKATGSVFAPGRTAEITILKKSGESRQIGLVGEISPAVLEELGLKVPVSAFEVDVGRILEI